MVWTSSKSTFKVGSRHVGLRTLLSNLKIWNRKCVCLVRNFHWSGGNSLRCESNFFRDLSCQNNTNSVQFVPCFKAKTVQTEKWQQNWVLLRKNRFSKLESDPSQLGHTTKFLSHHWHHTNVRHNLGEVLGVIIKEKRCYLRDDNYVSKPTYFSFLESTLNARTLRS